METVLKTLLALSAIFFVGYPLFRPGVPYNKGAGRLGEVERMQSLINKKEESYRLIKDLEMDYKMGKLSLEDYQELEGRYKQEAIEILKKIDAQDSKKKLEEEIEQELRALRQKGKREPVVALSCPGCSLQVISTDNFCPQCGHNLKTQA
jgi:rubrerythrin